MRVLEGSVSVLEGDKVVEVEAGGWHFRPRGIVHTFLECAQ
jgi:quercetin dioxygenase-like cupin family protein